MSLKTSPQTSPFRTSTLLTDLYELTMFNVYVDSGMEQLAVFELFVRKLRPGRNFLIAAGLEQALDYLEQLHVTEQEVVWLEQTGKFSPKVLDRLRGLRFTGDVDAMAEGTVFFPDEPVLRITAPIAEAQLVESRLINLLHYQTLVASKAARCVLAAPNRQLVDFGLRRAHGAEAGVASARACYLSGFSGTATVLAGQQFDIPIFGTMAHSFIQAHEDEYAAFSNFAKYQPNNLIFLIDTYDIERGAERVVQLSQELKDAGSTDEIRAVRIDSGDLTDMAHMVRKILDAGGLTDVQILASGGLDEYRLGDLIASGAPIDGFGVGTSLNVSADSPYLDYVYKLQEYDGKAKRKRSAGKSTWPGRKQVYRELNDDGTFLHDTLTLESDQQPGKPLLVAMMKEGRRIEPSPSLESVRAHTAEELSRLPNNLRRLEQVQAYDVIVSEALRQLTVEVDRNIL